MVWWHQFKKKNKQTLLQQLNTPWSSGIPFPNQTSKSLSWFSIIARWLFVGYPITTKSYTIHINIYAYIQLNHTYNLNINTYAPFQFPTPTNPIRNPTSHSSFPFHPSISAAQSCMASSRLRRQRRRTSTSLPSAAGSDAKGAASAMSSAYGPNSRKSLMMMLTNPPGPNIYRINTNPNLYVN